MAEKKYNILKAVSWYTIGNILIQGVNFFVLPVFTRLMSTYEYGVYGVYTSYLSIIQTVILLGLSSTIAVAQFSKEVDKESYLSTAICIPASLTIICMVLINAVLFFQPTVLSMDAVLWNCLLLTAGSAAVCGIVTAKLVIDGRYKLNMLYSGLHVFLNVGISLILCFTVYRTHDAHLARIYGNTAGSLICTGVLLTVTRTGFHFKRVDAGYAFAWGIPLLFHTVATVILTQSDRILIRYLDSYESAGIYAVATTIVTIPLVLETSFCQAWQPWFFGKLDNREYDQIRWLNDRFILLFGAMIASFMLVSPEIIRLFTEESYWPATYCLVPLTVSVFAELLYSIPTSVEYYNKKTTFIMTATIITVVINILLDILFIHMFGYLGAAYATALSKIILFLMHYYFSRKLDQNSLFSNRTVILMLFALAVVNAVTVFTIKLFVIRYVILLCILMPCGWYAFKNRTLLLSKLKGD